MIVYSVSLILFVIALTLFIYMLISSHTHSKKLLIETELLKGKVEQDALTGAGSRSFGTTLLQNYLETFKANGNKYAIAILDIDNFKKINDTYGHNSGDVVMKNLVDTIQSLQTTDDHIIRWGGDEFILTYKNHENDLNSVLSTLNKKIASQSISTDSVKDLQYTISIGASHFYTSDQTISDTIKRIDDALYLAKRVKNSYYIIR